MPGEIPARFRARYPVTWAVTLRFADWRRAKPMATANVARGGAYLRTSQPPAVGERVSITLRLPDQLMLQLGGTVRRVDRDRGGIAVEFDAAHATDLILLEQMALTHSEPIR
jgi:hypothetical protein